VACAAAVWAPLRADAADPRIGKFTKYDTGDFVIVTSRSSDQARQIMQKLVKFRVTLEKFLGRRAARSGIGTHIVIVSAGDWDKYVRPGENVAGFFQRGKFDNFMAMNGDVGDYAVYVMFHEYTHYYLASQFAGEYPPWFNEGLAELMAYAKFTPDNRVALQIPMERVYEARDSDWIPFERLIKVDYRSPEYQSHQLAQAFYAQAWLTVHYGMIEDRAFGRQFMDYLAQMNELVPQEEAARNAFGDLAAVDAKLREYSRKTSLSSGAMDLGEIPEVTLPKGQPMSEADGYAAIIDVMLATNREPAKIRPLVEALQKREPEAARTWTITARLAEQNEDAPGFEAAVDKAGKLLAAGDAVGRRELGMLLLNHPGDDARGDARRALKWLAEGVQIDADDPKSLWGLGTALTRLDSQLDLAETELTSAYEKVPASAAISMSLANLKNQQDRHEEMVRYLQDTIRIAGDLDTRRWATETLANVQQYVEEKRRVDEENRKQREAYEKQMADYEKKYGKPKKKK
jgi:hypothetical protein